MDVNLEAIQGSAGIEDVSETDAKDYIIDQAKNMYKSRESVIQTEILRSFEKYISLRTIDEKWKDHLYAMDQLREGINLRAYGQKNPLLEYKSEGFQMFQQMMVDTTSETVKRLFRTQIQGIGSQQIESQDNISNVQTIHNESQGIGLNAPPLQEQAGISSPTSSEPVVVDEKIGRNQKVELISPSGEKVEVKYKKLQQYLNQGFSKV